MGVRESGCQVCGAGAVGDAVSWHASELIKSVANSLVVAQSLRHCLIVSARGDREERNKIV